MNWNQLFKKQECVVKYSVGPIAGEKTVVCGEGYDYQEVVKECIKELTRNEPLPPGNSLFIVKSRKNI